MIWYEKHLNITWNTNSPFCNRRIGHGYSRGFKAVVETTALFTRRANPVFRSSINIPIKKLSQYVIATIKQYRTYY